MENRLKLAGMCDPINAATINAWLTKVSAVPGRTKPVSKVSPEPQKKPTELLNKAIRGMLPKTPLGKQMAKKLRLYPGAEHSQQAQNPTPIVL